MVPARDEAETLPSLVDSLDRLLRPDGWGDDAVETLVLLNNCRDGSGGLLRALAASRPWLRVAEVHLGAGEAHVGRARSALFDAAAARLHAVGRPDGLILTTDADSRPAPDWLVTTAAEIAAGADLIGGRVGLDPVERGALTPAVRRFYLLDLGYRRAVERLRETYAPTPFDPCPRHHQHYGASLAVRADMYLRAGGMPAVPTSEDVALVRAVEAVGGRVRHSDRVRVATSARRVGRASGGLADAFQWWAGLASGGGVPTVESGAEAEVRLARLAVWRSLHPGAPDPVSLVETPPGAAPINRVLLDLRARADHAAGLTEADRLARARRLSAHRSPLDMSVFPTPARAA